jgi:tetratricopeptide (TPR) repeat protein
VYPEDNEATSEACISDSDLSVSSTERDYFEVVESLTKEIQQLKAEVNSLLLSSKSVGQEEKKLGILRHRKINSIVIVFVIIGFVNIAGFFFEKQSLQKDLYLLIADLYSSNNNTHSSVEILDKAVSLGINGADAWEKVAKLYLRQGQYQKSVLAFRKAILAEKKNASYRFELADAYNKSGREDLTEQELLSIVKEFPDQAYVAYLDLASLYRINGQYELAVSAFQKAADTGASPIETSLGLGNVYMVKEEYQASLPFYLKVAEIDPENYEAHLRLGDIYQKIGNCDKALNELLIASQIYPDGYISYSLMGACYLEKGMYREAIHQLEVSIEKQPSLDAYINLSKAYFAKGDCQLSFEASSKALEINLSSEDAKDLQSQCQE